MSDIDKRLADIYFDVSNPGAYGGIEKLYREAKARNLAVTREQIRSFLSGVTSYTLTKPIRHHFRRNTIYSPQINFIHACDLADMQKLSKWNKGIKYILCVIDIYSKKAWTIGIRSKSAQNMRQAFVEVYADEANRCRFLWSDLGSEFWNKDCSNLFSKLRIHHYSTHNQEIKSSVVERFIRSLKNLIYKFMLANLTRSYIDSLADITNAYNDSYHHSIKMAPSSVNAQNSDSVMKTLYPDLWTVQPDISHKPKTPFALNDTVLISKRRGLFSRGYSTNWSPEIFTIKEVITSRRPPVYRLVDQNNKIVAGTFYSHEIQRIKPSDVYLVERVIRYRINKSTKQKEYLVKWRDFPESENSWVGEEDLLAALPDNVQQSTEANAAAVVVAATSSEYNDDGDNTQSDNESVEW